MKELLELHMKHVDEKFELVRADIGELKTEVKMLVNKHWFRNGVSAAVGAIAAFLLQLFVGK